MSQKETRTSGETDADSPRHEQPSEQQAQPQQLRVSKATPLPMRQMIPMAFVLLNESICTAMLLPFVGLLVAHLQNRPVEEAGYLSGMMVGVFMLGQVISGRMWGYLSDQYGRRFPLVSGLFTSGIIMLLFGLSFNVWMCAAFRFLQGLFNGNVLVAKTMMADITDKSNQAKGFALVSLCFGIGTLVGSAVGGILYDPANSSAMSWAGFDKNGLFAKFPALLPSLVISVYSIVGMAVCTFFVQESNTHAKPLPRALLLLYPCMWRKAEPFVPTPVADTGDGDQPGAPHDQGEQQQDGITREQDASPPHSTPSSGSEDAPHKGAAKGSVEADVCADATGEEGREADEPGTVAVDTSNADAGNRAKPFGYIEAFKRPITCFMLITYILMCAGDIAFNEVFPLWAIASRSAGGLGYGSQQVGFLLLTTSVPCIVANLVFHMACDQFPNKMSLFRLGTAITGASIAFLPFTSHMNSEFDIYTCVIFCIWGRQFFSSWCYGLITMLTARAAPPAHIGSIMGINQSCGAASRCVVPFIAAPLFAWSISGHHVFPFNFMFVFFLSALTFFFSWFRSFHIRGSADGTLVMSEHGGLFDRLLRRCSNALSCGS